MNDNRECSDMYHENMSGVIPYETFESRPPRRKARYIRVKRRAAAFALVLSVGFSAAFGFGAGNALGSAAAGAQNSSPQAAPVSSGYTQLSASGTDMNVEQVAAATANSVVEITTEIVSTDPRMGQYVTEGAGSGVIISSDGYIVTNNHVIEGASKITVRTRSGDTYSGTLIGTDEKTDLAVVKVDATGLSPATIGSSDDLVVGQSVVAIGNPLGNLGGTVTDGDCVMRPLEEDIDRQLLRAAVEKLSERERQIISMRFGLGGAEEKTQKEVADALGISQSYISRLEKRIILRLRREMMRSIGY